MNDYELDAWLGDARSELTDEQYERMMEESDAIEARYPDSTEEEEATAALSATLQYILGETTVEEVGQALIRARLAEAEAFSAAQQVARLAVLDGAQKVQTANVAGVDRKSLYRALGASY